MYQLMFLKPVMTSFPHHAQSPWFTEYLFNLQGKRNKCTKTNKNRCQENFYLTKHIIHLYDRTLLVLT